MRLALCVAALCMIEGGWLTDLIGLGLAAIACALQKGFGLRRAA